MRQRLASGLVLAFALTGLVGISAVLVQPLIQFHAGLDSPPGVDFLTDAPTAGAGTTPVPSQDGNGWMVLALVAMSLATAAAVTTAFYLYRWRRILLATPHLLVPEEWGRHLDRLGQDVQDFGERLELNNTELRKTAADSTAQVADMAEGLLTLQRALDDRDTEIRRLKEGYDARVFQKFLKRFVKVHQALVDCIEIDASGPEPMDQIKRLLEDAFEECGLQPFAPDIGTDYRTADGVADNPKKAKASSAEEAFRIAEVLSPGYRLTEGARPNVIVPSKVRIFIYED